jgi:hypothetical protein
VKCCRMWWPVMCSLLVALTLAGCNYGDKNKAPIATADTAITAREVPVRIKVLVNDSDPDGDQLEVVGVTQGANGEVSLNGDGTVTYTPAEAFLFGFIRNANGTLHRLRGHGVRQAFCLTWLISHRLSRFGCPRGYARGYGGEFRATFLVP